MEQAMRARKGIFGTLDRPGYAVLLLDMSNMRCSTNDGCCPVSGWCTGECSGVGCHCSGVAEDASSATAKAAWRDGSIRFDPFSSLVMGPGGAHGSMMKVCTVSFGISDLSGTCTVRIVKSSSSAARPPIQVLCPHDFVTAVANLGRKFGQTVLLRMRCSRARRRIVNAQESVRFLGDSARRGLPGRGNSRATTLEISEF
jgi:hypothetical protein